LARLPRATGPARTVERQRAEDDVEAGPVESARAERKRVDAWIAARIAVEAEHGRPPAIAVTPPARPDDPVLRERREILARRGEHRRERARERDVDARAAGQVAESPLVDGPGRLRRGEERLRIRQEDGVTVEGVRTLEVLAQERVRQRRR